MLSNGFILCKCLELSLFQLIPTVDYFIHEPPHMLENDSIEDLGIGEFSKIELFHEMQLEEHPNELSIGIYEVLDLS